MSKSLYKIAGCLFGFALLALLFFLLPGGELRWPLMAMWGLILSVYLVFAAPVLWSMLHTFQENSDS